MTYSNGQRAYEAYTNTIEQGARSGATPTPFEKLDDRARWAWIRAEQASIAGDESDVRRELQCLAAPAAQGTLELALEALRGIDFGEHVLPDEKRRDLWPHAWTMTAGGIWIDVYTGGGCGHDQAQAKLFGAVVRWCKGRGLRLRHALEYTPRFLAFWGKVRLEPYHEVTISSPGGAHAALAAHEDLGTAALVAYARWLGANVEAPHPHEALHQDEQGQGGAPSSTEGAP